MGELEELEIYIHTSHDGNEIRKVSFEVLNERPQNVSKKGYTFYNDNASDELGVGLFIYNGTNWVNVFTEYKHFKRTDTVTNIDFAIDDTINANNTISIIKKLTITDEGHIKDIEFIDIDYNHVGAAKAMHTHNTEDIIFNSPDRLLGSTNDGATFELSAENVLTFLSIAKGEIDDLINYNQLNNPHRVWTASTIIEYVSTVVGQQITGALIYQNTGYIGQINPGTLILPIPEGGATIPIDKGMVWVVSTNGFFGTERVEGGDMIIALVDNATNDDDFQVINKNITLVDATNLISGIVKLFSDTIQSVDANDVTSTSGRTYGIQTNSSGQLVVNVPWTDNGGLLTIGTPTGLTATGTFAANQSSNSTITLAYATGYQGYTTAEANKLAGIEASANNYTLPTATNTVLGGVKLFSNTNQTVAANTVTTTASRTYGIQTNSSGQLVVNVPWVDTNTDTTYSGSTSIILSGTSFQRAALTGDVISTQNSNATTIANNVVTFAKMQNIATQRLLGRGAAGSGNIEEITLGSGISLSTAGVLSATGSGGTVTSVAMSVPTGLTVTGSPITSSGTLTLGFASGYSLPTITKQGNWDTAFNKTIKAVAVTGTTTKTITLTREDDTVLTANWADYSVDTITRLRGTTTGTYTSGDLTLLAGTNVTISQSGSNFTIGSTDTTYTGGTGISISGTTINNTAPNITQVLSLSGNILTLSNGGSSVTLPSATRVGTTPGDVTSGDILIVGGGSASVSKSGNTITITGTNTTYTAGNGLTLSSGAFSMGTPSAISLTSTNSTTSNSHTHEFAPGGTTAQYIRGDGSLATMPAIGNGSLTIGTPTGLSSSGIFTANQSGNSAITLVYDTGYQGYTTAEATKLAGIEDNANNYILPTATDTILGGVKLFSNTTQTVATTAVSATASRTYGIQMNSDGQLVVNVPWTNTNTTYTGSTSISLVSGSFQRAALTGDVTSAQNSNATTIANNAVTFTKMQNIATQRLMGRGTAGTGNIEEITLGTGLSLSTTGILSATGSGGTVTSVAMSVPTGLTVTGSPITSSGTLAVGFASGYSLPTTAKQGQWDAAYGWGNHAGLYSLLNHTHVTSNVTALTGYTLGTNTALTSTMSLNTALGNLQAQINTKTSNSGTVTSVGMTIAGNALNTNTATITSSGTFGLTWGGTAAQYVNGQGALVTFPTIPTVGNGTLTLSTSADLTGSGTFTANQSGNSSFTVGLSTSTINKINNGQTAYGWGNHSSLYVPVSEYKNFGDIALSSASGSTADFIARLTTIGFFNYRKATGKASWSYAGNQDITDTPYGAIETAGAVIETWHYGSAFNIIVYCANTGGSTPGRVFMYNDQGATYSPGWREIMTDNSPINGYVPTTRTVTAGNGLTGGGALSGNITLTMGAPSAITLTSTNSVTTSSHTHAFTPGGTTAQYIRGDGSLASFPSIPSNYTLPTATTTVLGGVKLFSNTVQTVAATAVSATASRTYGIQLNSSGQLVVNVPWVNTNTNTTYSAGTGLSLSGTTFGQTITTSGSGTYVQSITQTASGFQVNLGTPPNTNTTYSAGTLALLQAGTDATNRIWRADHLNQGIKALTYNPGNLTFGSGLNYNASTGVLTTASQDSIFAYSPQGGLYTTDWSSTALGQHSVAIGYTSVVTASSSISIGKGVFTGGAMSQNIGFSSNVNNSTSSNFGSYNLNSGIMSNTYGQGLISRGMGLTVIGKYNQTIDHQPNMDGDAKTAAIQFGVGKDELTRRNAVTIYNDRRMDYDRQRDDSSWNLNTIPDIKWIQENISGGGGGTGGAATHIYTDSATEFHVFNDYNEEFANGLVSEYGLANEEPIHDIMYNSVGVWVLETNGSYVKPNMSNIYGQIGVSIGRGVIVNQGVIVATDIRRLDIPYMRGATYLVLTLNKEGNTRLSWLNAGEIREERNKSDNFAVIFIGQIYDYKDKPYFNVNPQVL